MKRLPRSLVLMVLSLIMLAPAMGQTLQERLSSLLEENGREYLAPLGPAFTIGVNSGTFHTAKPHKLLGFDVTLNAAVIMIPDTALTFNFLIDPGDQLPFDVTLPQPIGTVSLGLNLDDIYEDDRSVPTLFGTDSAGSIEVDVDKAWSSVEEQLVANAVPQSVIDAQETTIRSSLGQIPALPTPPGIGFPYFPMVVPQASVGLPLGIELTLRGMPDTPLGDVGNLSYMGYGGKIGLSQFIPIPQVFLPQISIGYYTTMLNITVEEQDLISFQSSVLNLQLSKSIPFITVYGGIGIENGNFSAAYTAEIEEGEITVPVDVSFDYAMDPTVRMMAGLRLKLLILDVSLDYSDLGEYQAIGLGAGISFR